MSRLGLLTALVFTFCLCSPLPPASAVDGRSVKVEPFTLTTFDGQDHPAELVRITVPENRHSKSQRIESREPEMRPGCLASETCETLIYNHLFAEPLWALRFRANRCSSSAVSLAGT